MAVAKTNRTVPVTLTPFHIAKLDVICQKTGLSKTGVIQRLIEEFDPFKKVRQADQT